jgi:hypothetical protein
MRRQLFDQNIELCLNGILQRRRLGPCTYLLARRQLVQGVRLNPILA